MMRHLDFFFPNPSTCEYPSSKNMTFASMPINLIMDAWIPVLDKTGARRIIAPWQIADRSLAMPDWPRADLNLACYEFLIGLVFLADPPRDHDDWEARVAPEPERLRNALLPHAEAFELMGDGPRFLQDPRAMPDFG
ncbi:type I-E CRISPR-associated protein Cse1/CasA [Rhodovulum sp. 12E13]|nr:type I-E CRISPR-associated protein Cse1/CasA [Rhodovulum sp. 12E13]